MLSCSIYKRPATGMSIAGAAQRGFRRHLRHGPEFQSVLRRSGPFGGEGMREVTQLDKKALGIRCLQQQSEYKLLPYEAPCVRSGDAVTAHTGLAHMIS